ncbi:hypothetical protein ACFWPK_26775 [Nocardia sp. NPDC058519]|uniref:hypothetical protein n=1 Tax=Nocardia sp. NPDC058519 TaxID=3346535 RepID=UPI0036550361
MQSTAGIIAVGAGAAAEVVGATAAVVAGGGAIAGVLVGVAACTVVGVGDSALDLLSAAQPVTAASIATAIATVRP